MKKGILFCGIAVMILVLAVLVSQSRGGDVRDVERIESNCTLYTGEEIETAMDLV